MNCLALGQPKVPVLEDWELPIPVLPDPRLFVQRLNFVIKVTAWEPCASGVCKVDLPHLHAETSTLGPSFKIEVVECERWVEEVLYGLDGREDFRETC